MSDACASVSAEVSDVSRPSAMSAPGHAGLYNASYATQLEHCVIRQFKLTYRNSGLWLGNWSRAVVMALILGSTFYQLDTSQIDVKIRFSLFYYLVTYYGNQAIQMISVLIASRSIVHHERKSLYYTGAAHMLSLMVVFVPLAVMETFLLSIILYPMVGLRGGVGSSEFGFFFLYLLFCDLIGRSWVLLVSSVTAHFHPGKHPCSSLQPALLCLLGLPRPQKQHTPPMDLDVLCVVLYLRLGWVVGQRDD